MTREPLPRIGALYAHNPTDGLDVHERGRDLSLRRIRELVEQHDRKFDLRAVYVETTTTPDQAGRVHTRFEYDPKRYNDGILAQPWGRDPSPLLIPEESR